MSSADRREPLGTSARWLRAWPQRYGFALMAVAVATLARYSLDVALGFTQPFVLFYPTIMLIALLCGFGAGVFSTLLSVVLANYLLIEPLGSFAIKNPKDDVGLVLFGVMGVAISGLGHLFRQRTERLQEFEKAAEGLEEMIVVVDRDYRYVMANEAFLSYRGMKREEVIGRRIADILSPGIFESTIKEKVDECFQGKVVQYELSYEYASLGERDLFISYFPIEGPNGVDRVASVLQDITQRKQSERSLKLFRTLIDHSNDAVEVVDPETLRLLDANEKACKDLGYTREELLSLTVYDIDPNADASCHETVLAALREFGSIVKETVHRRKDGSTFPVEASLKYVQLEQGYVVAVSRDISERKKAEHALSEGEDRYRDLVEHSEDLLCTHDLEGNLLSVNPAPARLLGYDVNEMLSIPMRKMIPPEYQGLFDEYLARIKTTGFDRGLMVVLTRTGERRTWEYSNTLRTDGVTAPVVRGMAHDVTERRHAELAKEESEKRYRLLFEKNVAGVAISGVDGRVSDCNDAWARMLGYDKSEEIRGRSTKEFYLNAVDRGPLLSELEREGALFSREVQLRKKDGTPVWVLFNCEVMSGDDGAPLVQATAIDITERKRAEAALSESERHFRILVEQASDGIFIADAQGRYIDVNSAGAEMLGYTREEILQLTIYDLLLADEIPGIAPLIARYARGETVRSEWTFRRKDGSLFPGEVSGKQLPDGRLQGILRDMTERRQAEEAMRQSAERFRVALKDSPITVFNQDRDLRYTWIYNPHLYWQHEIVGRTDAEIVGTGKAARLDELKRRVLKTGVALREEVQIPHGGKHYAFDLTIEPLFDADGSVIGITGASMDIARLRELADSLQDARDKLAHEKSYLESEIQSELGFEEIIGQSPALREVLKKARVVAPTDSTVLLLGETGTGKELVARSVHALSGRHDKSFIKLNCAAVPSGLLESELFGHEKGAFTSAVNQKIGRIELADKGTLFLDEVGELPLELQPKLLRVLQDREFERLGGVRTLHVDVRIISATNRNLQEDIAQKKFREDLFYRLNVFPIDLPALRERRSDIPMLVQHFVRKHAVRMGRQIETIPDETMAVLQNWNWPGNIRELENMIERMIILSKGRVLAPPPQELDVPLELADDSLNEMEREHILRVLRETNGVLSGTDGAASRLGIKRTTLQSMLKRFGIGPEEYRRRDRVGSQG